MQIKLQSNDYHVLVNTLGAELNSYSSPEGKEYIWNSDPRNCYQRSYISDAQAWFLLRI